MNVDHARAGQDVRPYPVNINYFEQVMKRAEEYARAGRRGFQEAGLRAARVREPRLMRALEDLAEQVDKLAEAQHGRTVRDPGRAFAERAWPSVASFYREAYRVADEGRPEPGLAHYYGVGALLAGLVD